VLCDSKRKELNKGEKNNLYVTKTLGERSPWLINKGEEREKGSKIDPRK